MTLAEALKSKDKERLIVRDAVALVESEVAGKSGLRGMAVRTGFKGFKKLKPGIVPLAVQRLLPHFAPVIDDHIAQGERSVGVQQHFQHQASQIAESLLQVTDRMAAGASNGVMKKIYQGLRGQALGHVAAAVPRLPAMIQAHLS